MGLPRLFGALNKIVLFKNYNIMPNTEQTHLGCSLIVMLVPDSVLSISEMCRKERQVNKAKGDYSFLSFLEPS